MLKMKNKKENLKILILIGIPGSGKSTWAKHFIRKNPDYVRINRDDFRTMLHDYTNDTPKMEDLVTKLVSYSVQAALSKKYNVIIDNTNLKVKYIEQFIKDFKYMADISYMVFDVSLQKAIERDKDRDRSVGESVIKKMYEDYKNLIDSFHFQPIEKVINRKHVIPSFELRLPECVIFDIDGTLALIGDRSPYDAMSSYKDDLNRIVAEQVEHHRSKGRTIILMSGREEMSRKITEEWMELYGVKFDHFFMRSDNDYRSDVIVKKELFNNHIKDNYNTICVYDDRLSICKLYYELGVFVFCVNQGLIEF